ILGPGVEGAVVFDLFAGTGSLALEALSRGAAHAVMFENDPDCAEAVRRNVAKLRYGDRATLFEGSTYEGPDLVLSEGRKADIIFVDPPYAVYDDEAQWAQLRETIECLPLAAGGTVVLEHRSSFEAPEKIGKLAPDRVRKYGGTTLTFYK
ncbi:MAG: RsmD family RNA methyltransferase, partial [Planctomycetota bacterium]